MFVTTRMSRFSMICLVLGFLIVPILPEPLSATSPRYNAQRKPRVTVMAFDNTNSDAQGAMYGQSVEAMLVTFLKRKSQFVVVERQKLGPILEEWENNQLGMTNLSLEESRDREILEKLDAIILGSVTLLGGGTVPEVTHGDSLENSSEAELMKLREGSDGQRRIEIDVKLLSRDDGRIIAAVQRSGPVLCLRSIVERLGVALEREFLRPYYGKLTFKLSAPENTHLYLTPVVTRDAMDEEKPPIERGATVRLGTTKDIVEPWTTDPTTYTVEDILSGWYSIRLERPGYEVADMSNARWLVRNSRGRLEVYEARTGKPLSEFSAEVRRFLVWVDPLEVELVDGDALGFEFRRQLGSIQPLVKRQYLDHEYGLSQTGRIMLIGKDGIELNRKRQPAEFTDDQACDLFEEHTASPVEYGRTHVAAGQTFDVDSFLGGELVIEEYTGETVPVGQYQMVVWEPNYVLHTADVSVRDRDRDKVIRSTLIRQTVPLDLFTTGPKPDHHGILRGEVTHQAYSVRLDFEEERPKEGLPVDRYSIRSDIPGFGAWQQTLNLLPEVEDPPVFDPDSADSPPIRYVRKIPQQRRFRFKTRLTLAGRVEALGPLPDAEWADWYEDKGIRWLLEHLLRIEEEIREELGDDQRSLGSWHGMAKMDGPNLLGPDVRELQREATGSVSQESSKIDETDGEHDQDEATQTADRQGSEDASSMSEEEKEAWEKRLRNPRFVRELFAQSLLNVDLLVLGSRDLQRIQEAREVRSLVEDYIEAGGALVAFAMEPGNYNSLFGQPLSIADKKKKSKKFRLTPGPGRILEVPEKKQKLKKKRRVPRFEVGANAWRILAYGHRPGHPRILERGRREAGGYVLVWGDAPHALGNAKPKRAEEIDKVRRQVAERAIDWARFLMYRELDDMNHAREEAEARLTTARGR